MREIMVGDRVRNHVYVGGKSIPMNVGIVVRDCGDGCCEIDVMSLHGGAPWIIREPKHNLKLDTYSNSEINHKPNS